LGKRLRSERNLPARWGHVFAPSETFPHIGETSPLGAKPSRTLGKRFRSERNLPARWGNVFARSETFPKVGIMLYNNSLKMFSDFMLGSSSISFSEFCLFVYILINMIIANVCSVYKGWFIKIPYGTCNKISLSNISPVWQEMYYLQIHVRKRSPQGEKEFI
jgi:hypothetical protein